MKLSRFAVLLAVFTGISVPAGAQYTTKAETSGFTTKTTGAAKTPATSGFTARTSGATAQPSAGTAKTPATSGFTTRSSGAAAQASAGTQKSAAKQAAAQPVFRPRPQETPEPKINEEVDDELPSFDALEGKNPAVAAAQGQTEAPPPPPPPKGEVWVYIADFDYRDLTGMTMNCGWKVVVQNRTDATIERLDLAYQILDVNFIVYLNPTPPNSSQVTEQGLFSPKCPAMARLKPKVTVKKCKMGTLVDQDCFNYISVK